MSSTAAFTRCVARGGGKKKRSGAGTTASVSNTAPDAPSTGTATDQHHPETHAPHARRPRRPRPSTASARSAPRRTRASCSRRATHGRSLTRSPTTSWVGGRRCRRRRRRRRNRLGASWLIIWSGLRSRGPGACCVCTVAVAGPFRLMCLVLVSAFSVCPQQPL